MKVLGIRFGKKYVIRYSEGTNEKTLRSEEAARPELPKALLDIEREWSEAVYQKEYGRELEVYEKEQADKGELAREQVGKTTMIIISQVDVMYEGDVARAYTLSGDIVSPGKAIAGNYSGQVEVGKYPDVDLAVSWLLAEAKRYVNGERAQMELPGLPKAPDGERPYCGTCPYAEKEEDGKTVCEVSGEVFDKGKTPLWCTHMEERRNQNGSGSDGRENHSGRQG